MYLLEDNKIVYFNIENGYYLRGSLIKKKMLN